MALCSEVSVNSQFAFCLFVGVLLFWDSFLSSVRVSFCSYGFPVLFRASDLVFPMRRCLVPGRARDAQDERSLILRAVMPILCRSLRSYSACLFALQVLIFVRAVRPDALFTNVNDSSQRGSLDMFSFALPCLRVNDLRLPMSLCVAFLVSLSAG